MNHWYDQEEQDLHDQLARGDITKKEFTHEMIELRRCLRDEAEQAADRARDSVLGGDGWSV